MKYLTAIEAKQFADKWLPAWSGNNPELLAGFYSEDALYIDPGIPGGVKGKSELLAYFRKLLANNPDWVWSQIEGIPLEDGFLNKWLAKIPVGPWKSQVYVWFNWTRPARSVATKYILTAPGCLPKFSV